MDILIATNNNGKVERFRTLLTRAGVVVTLHAPEECGIRSVEVPENAPTLMENAEQKARAYFGKTTMPILANDTGVYVEGEGMIDAPKRIALGDVDEEKLTREEINTHMLNFWKAIATKYGGRVDAAWVEAFVLLNPDGTIKRANSRREVVLTDTEHGVSHEHMPLRALYISKTTGKPAIQHTEEEEMLEMKPVVDALKSLLV